MTIDWSKAPEGATHWNTANNSFYKIDNGNAYIYKYAIDNYEMSVYKPSELMTHPFAPRPTEPKPYTRDEALQFLVERLDSWPTDIADAPLCPGWGWESRMHSNARFASSCGHDIIELNDWLAVGLPSPSDFVPFVSVEDAQPATAKQPAPSGKGDPILGMVLADLTNRALEGREKYGEALKANNGRNALWDAYQEALDLTMYLRQAIEEQHRAQTDR